MIVPFGKVFIVVKPGAERLLCTVSLLCTQYLANCSHKMGHAKLCNESQRATTSHSEPQRPPRKSPTITTVFWLNLN